MAEEIRNWTETDTDPHLTRLSNLANTIRLPEGFELTLRRGAKSEIRLVLEASVISTGMKRSFSVEFPVETWDATAFENTYLETHYRMKLAVSDGIAFAARRILYLEERP